MKKLTHKTILLVEDNATELSEIKSWINEINDNHTLCIVKSCREALDLLNGNIPEKSRLLPDVILLNIYSPVMDGVEFLEIIKSYFSLRSIKVFFMIPGFNSDEGKVSKQFNVDGILAKPFRLNFSGQANSLEKLKGNLMNSNGLRLQSLFVFPTLISDAFFSLRNLINQLLKSAIKFVRPIVFVKPVAITSLVITTALVTTATTISIKRKLVAPKINKISNIILKTEPVDLISKHKIDNSKKSVSKATAAIVQDINSIKTDSALVIPDSISASPVKEARKPLKIVVIEEEDELYKYNSDSI